MKFSTILRESRVVVCTISVVLGISASSASAQTSLSPGGLQNQAPGNSTHFGRILVAQASDVQFIVRIQELEEQIRLLNGQIEGLTFQFTQMQAIVNRMQEDTEFRLQALEGRDGEKTEALAQRNGGRQIEVQSQDFSMVPATEIPEHGVRPLLGEIEFDPTFDDGTLPDEPGQSHAPWLDTDVQWNLDLVTGQPLDLSYDPGVRFSSNDDANSLLVMGYDALMQGDYTLVEEKFAQFLSLYPDDPQATEAANWLGDVLLRRAAYSDAAEVLLEAYQKAPESPRASDLLLKLGLSLSGLGERDAACSIYEEISMRFTALEPAFMGRLDEERAKAECLPT